MGISRVINRRTAVLGLLLVILATAGFGFAATNTVPSSAAGDGAEVISGYVVSDIDYVLNTTADPAVITDVDFVLTNDGSGHTAVPEVVEAQVDSSGGAWYTCTTADIAPGPFDYTCTGGNTVIIDADQLRVIAHD